MAVMGELAEAVAHDFNNIVSATLIHLGLLLQDEQLSAGQKESLKTLEQENVRAAGLTRQLLAFSRRRFSSRDEMVDLNKLILGIEKLLTHLVRENIVLTFQPAAEECWIKADVAQVEKLVMSLCLVFREAMPRGGRLMLETSSNPSDGAFDLATPVPSGKHVCLTMTASSPETLSLVPQGESESGGWKFETARQIALRHGGWIELNAESCRTEIRVGIPAADGENEADRSGDTEEIEGGTETILLVEDEVFLRRVSALSLRKLGYAVLEAADGEAALKLWEKHQAKIDLLLADLMLPGTESGYELAQQFTATKPSLRVILASGNYADLDRYASLSGPAFFPAVKPYTGSRLATLVRECLDSPT